MSVCMIQAAVVPPEPSATTTNAVESRVVATRCQCEAFARQWQRETDQSKGMEHAAYYNRRSGRPETYGTMADFLGISR